MNYAVSGTDPWSYRVVNILLHLLNALLVASLSKAVLHSAEMPCFLRRETAYWSILGAALWAVHPLTTAAVAYVVQRAESLMSFFFLAGLWMLNRDEVSRTTCLLRQAAGSPGGGRYAIWQLATLACFLLGLATKEVAVMFAPISLVFDRWFLSPTWSILLARRGRLHAAVWGAAALYTVAMLGFSNGRDETAGFEVGVASVDYLTTQFSILPQYMALAVLLQRQSLDWGVVLVTNPEEWVPGLLVILVFIAPTIWGLVRGARWAFPGVWFFGILAPTSTIVPVATQIAAEQRVYLPLVGLVIGLMVFIRLGLAACRITSPRISVVLTLIAIAVCTAQTIRRNALYADPIALWSDAVRSRPENPRAYFNLMVQLVDRGRMKEAMDVASRALEIPSVKARRHGPAMQGLAYPPWHYNRGLLHVRMNKLDMALADFNAAVEGDPEFPDARANRAICLLESGRAEEALPDLDFLLERKLLVDRALAIKAWVYLKLDRLEESVKATIALEAVGGSPSPEYITALRAAKSCRDNRRDGKVAPSP
jgi:hypothetical protein